MNPGIHQPDDPKKPRDCKFLSFAIEVILERAILRLRAAESH